MSLKEWLWSDLHILKATEKFEVGFVAKKRHQATPSVPAKRLEGPEADELSSGSSACRKASAFARGQPVDGRLGSGRPLCFQKDLISVASLDGWIALNIL